MRQILHVSEYVIVSHLKSGKSTSEIATILTDKLELAEIKSVLFYESAMREILSNIRKISNLDAPHAVVVAKQMISGIEGLRKFIKNATDAEIIAKSKADISEETGISHQIKQIQSRLAASRVSGIDKPSSLSVFSSSKVSEEPSVAVRRELKISVN